MPAVGKVLAALDFLQRQRKLAHGNVKGSNVLLSSNGEVKLSDLSSCKNLREEFKQSSLSIVSSRGNPSDKRFRQAVPLHRAAAAFARTRRSVALYNVAFVFVAIDALALRAPEHGFPGHKRPVQDIWSVGILVAEMAAGRALYDASVKTKEILKIFGDVGHDLHPRNLHKTMPELQGMSDAFHDFLDEVGTRFCGE